MILHFFQYIFLSTTLNVTSLDYIKQVLNFFKY